MQQNTKPTLQRLLIAQMTAAPEQQGIKCFLCRGSHTLQNCPQMANIIIDEKAKSALKRVLEAQQVVLH